ncbi:hypothetical protein EON65_31395 [archaeon]|nr:MAG: hypothetical protein EON65_31395 [archaeon]
MSPHHAEAGAASQAQVRDRYGCEYGNIHTYIIHLTSLDMLGDARPWVCVPSSSLSCTPYTGEGRFGHGSSSVASKFLLHWGCDALCLTCVTVVVCLVGYGYVYGLCVCTYLYM